MDINKRKRTAELYSDQTIEQMSREKVISSTETIYSEPSEQNHTYNLQQPIYLNSIPVVSNQQLVYQVEGVQNLNNLNLANSNQNFVYIVIPAQNENLQVENVPEDVLRKDKQRTSDGGSVGKDEIEFVDHDLNEKSKEANKYFVYDTTQVAPQQFSVQPHASTIVSPKDGCTPVPPQPLPSYTTPATTPADPNKAIFRTHGYKCDYHSCGMAFISIYEKKAHMDTHLYPENTEFKCNICNSVFDRASDRNKHVETHAVVSTHKCEYCKQSFPYYTSLVKHIDENSTHKCEYCKQSFPYYTSLVKHIDENRCVTRNKLHACYFCGSKFVNCGDLEKHQETNLKVCLCKAKICGEQSFEVHINLCSVYKNKAPKSRKKLKTQSGVILK